MITHVNSATLVTGATGAGKTSLFATFALWLWKNYQQVLLYYACDGGGWPTDLQVLADAGIVRIWRMRTRGEAFETCMRASQGWWPAQIDPHTGEVPPGVRLVPPVLTSFELRCPQGHLIGTQGGVLKLPMVAACADCKTQIPSAQIQVTSLVRRTPGFEQVGGVAFDGISSMLSWQMSDMAGRHARMELKGEDTAIGGRVQSGELMLGGNNRAHYGFVQLRAEEMVLNSLSIPHLTAPPVWSALLLETTDEGGLAVKGPKLAGKAKTDEAPQWFGNALEAAVVKNSDGADVHRLYLQEYIDEAGVRHLCKNRSSPGSLPPYLEDPADPAAAFSQFSLGVFFDLMTKARETVATRYGALLDNAPGVPAGMVTYGGAQAPASSVPAATPTSQPVAAAPSASAPSVGGAPRMAPRTRKPAVVIAEPAPAPVAPVTPAPDLAPPVADPQPPPPAAVTPADADVTIASASAPPLAQAQPQPPVSVPVQAPRPALPRPVAAGGTSAPYAPPPGPRPPAPAPRVRVAPTVGRPTGGQ